MSDGDFPEAVHYLAAIRMAIEGAANSNTALELIDAIAEAGPQAAGDDLWPTRILVTAIQDRRAHIEVPA